jgi:hypothetical protein
MTPMDSTFVGGTVVALAVILVTRWLQASQRSVAPKAHEQDGARLLSYPKALRVLVGVFVAFPVGLLALGAVVHPKQDERWILWVMVGGFWAFALPAALEVFGVVHRFDQTGITSRSPWRPRRPVLQWADVVSVRYNPVAGWYALRSRGGDVVRVQEKMSGLGTFAGEVLANVPREAFNDVTRFRLSRVPWF